MKIYLLVLLYVSVKFSALTVFLGSLQNQLLGYFLYQLQYLVASDFLKFVNLELNRDQKH